MADGSKARIARWARRLPAVALSIWFTLGTGGRAAALPTLDELMADFGFAKDDVQRVRNGELVKTTTKETSNREIAAVMVFLVEAPVKTLISMFEAGGGLRNDAQVQAVTEIDGDGTVDALDAVVLEPDGDKEAERYLEAEPGDGLNLSAPEITAFRALKTGGGGRTQVEAELRRQLLARHQDYRAKGLAGIAPYARGKDEQTQPAEGLRRATEAAAGIKRYAPALHDALLNGPQGRPAGLEQRFFCIRYAMSGRPTFTLRHRLAMPVEDAYVLADREYYVSHDYNEMQAIAGLLPVEGGTAVLYLNRTTTDQLGGFGASAKQAIGRKMMANQISEIFEKSRAAFEKK